MVQDTECGQEFYTTPAACCVHANPEPCLSEVVQSEQAEPVHVSAFAGNNSVRCIECGQHCLFRPCKSCTNGLRSVPRPLSLHSMHQQLSQRARSSCEEMPSIASAMVHRFRVVDTAVLPDGDEHQHKPPLFSLAPRKRRSRDTLDAVRDSMLQLLVDPEHPATSVVEATRDGQDAIGTWLEFDLVAATRIDLGVLLQCKVIPACECVKGMSIEMRTKPVIHVRLYGDDEHRIVTSWEVVCAMPRTGGFVALRRRVSFEQRDAE